MALEYTSEYFLVSLDGAKDYLDVDGSGDDAEIGFLMAAVAQLFDTHTGRKLREQEITEYRRGNETDRLYLHSWPVSAVTSVHWDWDELYDDEALLASTDYRVNLDDGYISIPGGVWTRDIPIKIVYTAGYTLSAVPYDLRMGYLEALGVLWKRKQEGRFDVSTYSRGDVSYTYLEDMPHTVADVIKRYKRYG